ncbi:peptide/nickel transport system substrate-binding protein [Bradyrhizobium liaoningense]
MPTKANGGLAADGMSVIWTLKRGVNWHDGKPFTADDVVFTWQYAADLATAAYTTGSYKDIKVEKIDDYAVKVLFKAPTPFWADPFVGGSVGQILPKHHFGDYVGAKSREAPGNLKPVGTGPYKFVEFKPGDMIRAERNPDYHVKNQPHFDTLEVKGGGDAVSAARAVLQSGEYDFAWNMQVEEEVLKRMEAGGKGKLDITPSGNVEFIILNTTDPWTEVDGERSSVKTKHPTLSDPAVRRAINLLIDRDSIQKFIYGRGAVATASFVNAPRQFKSPKLKYEFDIDKANKILDEAGWTRGADGIREKDGKKLKYVFQTSTNAPRQKTQAIIKQACQKAGIEIEIKAVTASVFFSSDVGNPDTYSKFYADMEMYNTTQPQPDPERLLNQCVSWEIATKDNKWLGRNNSRYSDPERRQGLQGRAERARPGQARRAADEGRRDLLRGQCVPATALAPHRQRERQQPHDRHLGLGHHHVESGGVVSELRGEFAEISRVPDKLQRRSRVANALIAVQRRDPEGDMDRIPSIVCSRSQQKHAPFPTKTRHGRKQGNGGTHELRRRSTATDFRKPPGRGTRRLFLSCEGLRATDLLD